MMRSPALASDIGSPPRWKGGESRSVVRRKATGVEVAQILPRPSGDEVHHRFGGGRSKQDPVAVVARGRDYRAGGKAGDGPSVGGGGPQIPPLIGKPREREGVPQTHRERPERRPVLRRRPLLSIPPLL